MNKALKAAPIIIAAIAICCLTSCAGNKPKPIPNTAMGFEEGMRAIASSLADQVEQSSLENRINRLGKIKIKKIAIDPFIDAESGYQVKANDRIAQIISEEMKNRFDIGEMEPKILESAEYVLNGLVTVDGNRKDTHKDTHKVLATVFVKSSGEIVASSSVLIKGFDTTPKEIYKDSPVFLKGEDYKHQMESIRKPAGQTVNKEYLGSLTARSLQVKGDSLYEHRDYKQSLAYYNQAANLGKGSQLNILNGEFSILMAQGEYKASEDVYGRLLEVSLQETGEIASNICFAPDKTVPLKSRISYYNIYMKKIAGFVVSRPGCKLKIVGHCSRTGTVAYNDRLSKERAVRIQAKMEGYAPGIISRSTTEGRGFRENIVGTGKDDLTDLIDRRVEFIFYECAGK